MAYIRISLLDRAEMEMAGVISGFSGAILVLSGADLGLPGVVLGFNGAVLATTLEMAPLGPNQL